ncbi:MAG: SpoIID/LytB domain-containing protein [Planctomycetota bacterium]|jgi:SpoIID/LytB domain protein
MDQPQARDRMPSRRAFVARLAAVVVAPAGLAACRGDDSASGGAASSGGGRPPSDSDRDQRPRRPLPTAQPRVRVRVFKARGSAPAVQIGGAGQRLEVQFPPGRPREVAPDRASVQLRGPVNVTLGPEGWSLTDAAGRRTPIGGVETLEIAPGSKAKPGLELLERVFPGSLYLVARTDVEARAFDVVNALDMEVYLPGVVAGELYDHWLLETRAAQAIAARSFACSECAHYQGRRSYDLQDTAASQVYLGLTGHRASAEAVEMTRGVVLASDGVLVPGYYSSCCGGLAAAAVDAIGPNPVNDVAPLRGRAGLDVCSDARIARWTVERPVASLTRRLVAYGRQHRPRDLSSLAEIASIEVTASNEHGRPTRYGVTDVKGRRVELSANRLRSASDYTGPGLEPPRQPLWSTHLTVTVKDESAIIEGRGYGHGVGLCQYGAEMLARSGKEHEAIVAWYYPGAELVRVY